MCLLLLVSCASKETNSVIDYRDDDFEQIPLTIHAVLGDVQNTKTAVQSDGVSIYWTSGDAINLFYGNRSAGQFTSSITDPVESADFSGTLSVATGTTESGMSAPNFWGVYPYDAGNTCDGTGVTITIPANQQGIPDSFATNLNPTVATSPGLNLAFYNVGSWFLFSVTQDDIASATFKGNEDEDIVGTVRVTMDGSGHPVASVVSGEKSITFTPEMGDTFVAGEIYYMVLLPQTLASGYTLTLTKTDGTSADCVVSTSAEFVRSSFRRKRDADSGLVFKPTENCFNPDSYLLYKANSTGGWDANYHNYDQTASTLVGFSAKRFEMKFQFVGDDNYIAGILTEHDENKTIRIISNKLEWEDEEIADVSINLSDADVTGTSLIVLSFDGNTKTLSINGTPFTVPFDSFDIPCIFACRVRYFDEGRDYHVYGVKDNSKLYYCKAWDENDELIYLSYPFRAVNPSSGVEEYCWHVYRNNSMGNSFAHDSVNQGGYGGYIP